MADEIRKINVRIGGMSYQLVSAEDERYTRQIAATADEMIRRVMQNNPQLSQNMSAILALVNALDELARVRRESAGIDDQRQLHDRQLTEARTELSRLREQNWEIKKEMMRLGSLCKDYEALLGQQNAGKQPDSAAILEDTDDAVYRDEADDPPDAETVVDTDAAHAGSTPETDPETNPERQLTQTNLDEYLRDNGWPPVEPQCHDDQP